MIFIIILLIVETFFIIDLLDKNNKMETQLEFLASVINDIIDNIGG